MNEPKKMETAYVQAWPIHRPRYPLILAASLTEWTYAKNKFLSPKTLVLRRGIEPLLAGWKPAVLTDRRTQYNWSQSGSWTLPRSDMTPCCLTVSKPALTYYLVDRRRIELLLHACKAHVLPLSLTAQKLLNLLPSTVIAGINPWSSREALVVLAQ